MPVQEVKRETLTVEETAKVLGVSRGTAYTQINAGAILIYPTRKAAARASRGD